MDNFHLDELTASRAALPLSTSNFTLATIARIGLKPCDSAGLLTACKGTIKALIRLSQFDIKPTPQLTAFLSELEALAKKTELDLTLLGHEELGAPLKGLNTAHPQWRALITLGAECANDACLMMGGAEIALAWKTNQSISAAAAADILSASKADFLSHSDLRHLLWTGSAHQVIPKPWHARLRKSWEQLRKYFDVEKVGLAATFAHQVRGQIIETSTFAPAIRRMGASTHRQLSGLQLTQLFQQVKKWIDEEHYHGLLSFLLITTGLSADLIAQIPLSPDLDPATVISLDVHAGQLLVNLDFMAADAADSHSIGQPNLAYQLKKRLPATLKANLCRQLAKYPGAKSLADLYPDITTPQTTSCISDLGGEIKATWARLRHSTALHLRDQRINNLLAALLTLDFSGVPRSKLYYAQVSQNEFCAAEATLFGLIGLEA